MPQNSTSFLGSNSVNTEEETGVLSLLWTCLFLVYNFLSYFDPTVGRDSAVGIASGWRVRGSNPGVGEIFRTRSDRPWGPLNLLYNCYRVSFPRVKRQGCDVNHPPPFSAEVKEKVQLYLSLPHWASMTCSRANFTFIFVILQIFRIILNICQVLI
jgi:hypothetical protein